MKYLTHIMVLPLVLTALVGCEADVNMVDFGKDSTEASADQVEVSLHHFLGATETVFLQARVYTTNAKRVYVTGDHVSGEYDLFMTDVVDGREYWWSSNNPEGTVGNNNYVIGNTVPALPFTVVVNIVRDNGQMASYPVQVSQAEQLIR